MPAPDEIEPRDIWINGSSNTNGIGTIVTDPDGATITFSMATSNRHQVTLGGNRALAVSGVSVGQVFKIDLIQDATGGRTVTWWSGINWAGNTVPTLTTTAGQADAFVFFCTAANTYQGFVAGQNL